MYLAPPFDIRYLVPLATAAELKHQDFDQPFAYRIFLCQDIAFALRFGLKLKKANNM